MCGETPGFRPQLIPVMRTILHIGQHKTGTSSLQHFLREHRAELSRRGLYVPDSLAGFEDPSHFLLNVCALDENRGSPLKDRLLKTEPDAFFSGLRARLEQDIARHCQLAETQGCKDIIWSNEGLYLLNSTREYKRLRDLFEAYSSSVVCVCCFRERASFRSSYARELEKHGLGPSDEVDSYRYLREDSWLFSYGAKTALLREVFDEVITFPYDSRDNLAHFLQQIGYAQTATGSARLNVTGSTGKTEPHL